VDVLRLILFYMPLGFSAMLAGLTHVIINGVLARSPEAEITISTYAVALSVSFLLDLPINVLRQTSSKYARDQSSFGAVARLALILAVSITALSAAIGWTPLGHFIFSVVFGVKEELLLPTIDVFRVLAFFYPLTALRSLFQGVILNQLRTAWMTVGMVIRVIVMFAMSYYFIQIGWTNDGRVGAWIFFVGLVIEAAVMTLEGISLKRKLPTAEIAQLPPLELKPISRTAQLLPFYVPLLYSSLVTVLLNPSIQSSLNKGANPTLAVASFAVAAQLVNMMIWFCSFAHQAVLQFYSTDKRNVIKLTIGLSILAPAVLLVLSTDTAGLWLLEGVLGVHGGLLEEVQWLMRILSLQCLLFPWIDFIAGLAMLRGHTKAVMVGKFGSVLVSLAILILCVVFIPQLNGKIAAIAVAIAAPLELLVVIAWLRRLVRKEALKQAA
jgi:progressive ankylosis protein